MATRALFWQNNSQTQNVVASQTRLSKKEKLPEPLEAYEEHIPSRYGFFQDFPLFSDEGLLETESSSSSDYAIGEGGDEKAGEHYSYIIHPRHPLKIKWDILMGLIIVWTVSVTPYRIGFRVEPGPGFEVALDWVVDVFFWTDILMNFRTAYYMDDTLIDSPKRIANNYIRSWFILDFFSSFPFDSIVPMFYKDASKEDIRLLKMLRIFRLARLGKLYKLINTEHLQELIETIFSETFIALTKLLCSIFFVCHLFTCSWYLIGIVHESCGPSPMVTSIDEYKANPALYTNLVNDELCRCPISFMGLDLSEFPEIKCDNEISWVRTFEVYEMPHSARYVTSLYFVVKTILAVGYGDIHPTNTEERFFCIFLEIAGAIVYGYILSGITRSVEGTKLDTVKMKTILGWSDFREFDALLKRRIKQHYQYMLHQTNGYGDYMLVEVLPRHLRNEIVNKVWPRWIKVISLSLFKQSSGDEVGYDLVRDLLSVLRPQQLFAGDILCEQDDLLEDVYFVVSGEIEGLTDVTGIQKMVFRIQEREEEMRLALGIGVANARAEVTNNSSSGKAVVSTISKDTSTSNRGLQGWGRAPISDVKVQKQDTTNEGDVMQRALDGTPGDDGHSGAQANVSVSNNREGGDDNNVKFGGQSEPGVGGSAGESGGSTNNNRKYGSQANNHHQASMVNPLRDCLIVALFQKCEYFQTRFDPRSNDESMRISYLTYLAQSVSDLIAIPADVVIRRFREYHVDTTNNCLKKAEKCGRELDKCIQSGEYVPTSDGGTGAAAAAASDGGTGGNSSTDNLNINIKRRGTRLVLYKGIATPISWLAKRNKLNNPILAEMQRTMEHQDAEYYSQSGDPTRSRRNTSRIIDSPSSHQQIAGVNQFTEDHPDSDADHPVEQENLPANVAGSHNAAMVCHHGQMTTGGTHGRYANPQGFGVPLTTNNTSYSSGGINGGICSTNNDTGGIIYTSSGSNYNSGSYNSSAHASNYNGTNLNAENGGNCSYSGQRSGHQSASASSGASGGLVKDGQHNLVDPLQMNHSNINALQGRNSGPGKSHNRIHPASGSTDTSPSVSRCGDGGVEGRNTVGGSSGSTFVPPGPPVTGNPTPLQHQSSGGTSTQLSFGMNSNISGTMMGTMQEGSHSSLQPMTLPIHSLNNTNPDNCISTSQSRCRQMEGRHSMAPGGSSGHAPSPYNDGLQSPISNPEGALSRNSSATSSSSKLNRVRSPNGGLKPQTGGSKIFGKSGTNKDLGGMLDFYKEDNELLRRLIVPPRHRMKTAWDLFIGALILFSVIIVPYRIGFNIEVEGGSTSDVIDWTVDIFFAIDIFINFRTAYYDQHGKLVSDLALIRTHYLKGFFWIDFLSTFPFDRVLNVGRGTKLIRTVRLIRLAKLLRLFKIGTLLEDLYEIGISQRVMNAVQLVCWLAFIAHLLACFWFYTYLEQSRHISACEGGELNCTGGTGVCYLPGCNLRGWWDHPATLGLGINESYISALYWSFTTMTTVGYGDLRPHSTAERIYCIFVMFLGSVAFGYIIGSIAAAGGGGDGGGAISMKPVYDFCDKHSLSVNIRQKLRKHMTFYTTQRSNYDETTYLLELPIHLRIEVLLHVHRETLRVLSIFRARFLYRDWFIAHVVSLLRPMVVVAGDFIYTAQQREPYNIYNVFQGAVNAIESATEEIVGVYNVGMLFGLEGALDTSGQQKPDDAGYPHTMVAQPQKVTGVDRASVELFILTQEVIHSLEETGSVYFQPLKKVIATAWIAQGDKPIREMHRRKRKLELEAAKIRKEERQMRKERSNILNLKPEEPKPPHTPSTASLLKYLDTKPGGIHPPNSPEPNHQGSAQVAAAAIAPPESSSPLEVNMPVGAMSANQTAVDPTAASTGSQTNTGDVTTNQRSDCAGGNVLQAAGVENAGIVTTNPPDVVSMNVFVPEEKRDGARQGADVATTDPPRATSAASGTLIAGAENSVRTVTDIEVKGVHSNAGSDGS